MFIGSLGVAQIFVLPNAVVPRNSRVAAPQSYGPLPSSSQWWHWPLDWPLPGRRQLQLIAWPGPPPSHLFSPLSWQHLRVNSK